MRFFAQITALALALLLCLAGPLVAKPGKGGGGRHHSGHQHGGSGHGKKWSGQPSTHGHHGGGETATDKHPLADGHKKPPKKEQVKAAKPDKVAKPDKEKKHDKVAKDDLDRDADDEANDDSEDTEDGDMEDGDDEDDDEDGEPTVVSKKQKQLANFQRQRDKKLAQAEHLRMVAERNGNANLLANANRMEAQALEQYAKKVAHLEKFGVTDPLLNPNGGVIDPTTPPAVPSFPTGRH
jgi:hypothetical protein